MKIVSYTYNGVRKLGAVKDDSITLIPSKFDGSDILDAITNNGLQEALQASGAETLPLDKVTLELPFARPGKVVCLGLNYADHAAEGGYSVPDYPSLFLRVSTSLVAARGVLVAPGASKMFDYEAELMVVIGSTIRHATADNSLDAVFGYTCFNDGSLRDFQRRTAQWTAGKNFDATGSVGPWVVTADELPPGAVGQRIVSRINGEVMQDASTSDMLVSVGKAIEIVSEIMTLLPGDMIAMGTPQGVGHARNPPVWMKPGDVVEVEISGIGVLRNEVRLETPQFVNYQLGGHHGFL